ncbi:hypothetical protein RFI_23303 [Reticulomyxa filosa]|uniref:PPM-type phosphatase domain-containing protein n=1 Tax=Reticulomyxa filosa TaxID=46433 RepID=X6MK78_RETFI|nr:hypothetical protein RFI_23303 [Reticulomyxa filosa]|eukprot:ETO14066.1 hypothetical protein RFI_23303 [Reticulomyxa filosa]
MALSEPKTKTNWKEQILFFKNKKTNFMTEISTIPNKYQNSSSSSQSKTDCDLDDSSEDELVGTHSRWRSHATIRANEVDKRDETSDATQSFHESEELDKNKKSEKDSSNKQVKTVKEAMEQIHMIIGSEQEKGGKLYQEDSMSTFCSPDLSVIMASIFDGHGGLNGQLASSISAKMTKEYFEQVFFF